MKDSVLAEAYSYDHNGNRTTQTNTARGIASQTASYNIADQLTQDGNVTYQHDVDGYLTQKTDGNDITRYTYSRQGRLLSVQTPTDLIEYRHNAMGNRVAKSVNGQTTEKYLWLDKTTLLATYDANNNLKQRFGYTLGHTPTSFTQNGNRYYIATDHLGSPRAISDENGNVIKAIAYDSYGNVLSDSNPTFILPFSFAGGLQDRDTRLIRFGFRDYDPQAGRWTARDPIGLSGGVNTYLYVNANPVIYTDLLGLCPAGGLICVPTAYWVAGAVATAGAYTAGQWAANNTMHSKQPDVPYSGPAGEWVDGKRRSRLYGPDGLPVLDLDKPHQGYPEEHVHEWPNGEREHPGRDVCLLPPCDPPPEECK